MIIPDGPQKPADQNGIGDLKTSLTVWLSSLSIRLMSRYWPTVTAAVPESITYSQLKTTSSAVNGLPSCQATFFLSRQVTESPSLIGTKRGRLSVPALTAPINVLSSRSSIEDSSPVGRGDQVAGFSSFHASQCQDCRYQ